MPSQPYTRKALILLSLLLLVAAVVLSLICVLSGIHPGWFSEFYIIRMATFHAALQNILDKLPALKDTAATALDKLLDGVHAPDTISIYAASYCRETSVSHSVECSFRHSSTLDVAMGLRVTLVVLYASSIIFTVIGLAASLSAARQHSSAQQWHMVAVWTWLAFGCVSFASFIATIVVYAVCMIVAENVPAAVVAIQIGGRFLALTWAASACHMLSLAAMHGAAQHSGRM